MTDFNILYEKFQFAKNQAEDLRKLHLFAKGYHEHNHKYDISTVCSEGDKQPILIEIEEKDGELV